VALIEEIEAAKKVAEDTMSGTVGGFRSDVIGDKPIGPAPIAGMKTIADALHAIGGEEAKAAAIKAFNEAADVIAANVGALDKIKSAFAAKNEAADKDMADIRAALAEARDALLDLDEAKEVSEAMVEELIARVRLAEANTAAKEAALVEAKATADKLTETVAELLVSTKVEEVKAQVEETKVETPIVESTKPLTLAERIAARTKHTNESTLPGTAGVVASEKDAGEVAPAAPIVEGKKTTSRAAAFVSARKVLVERGYQIV
jgi:hypothetical protein